MAWFVIMQMFSILLEWLSLGRQTDEAKDLEILLLRRQLAILEWKLDRPLRVSRADKLPLVVLTSRLKWTANRTTRQLPDVTASSNRKRSLNSIANWSDASGLIAVRTGEADHGQTGSWNDWSLNWTERTVIGVMVASKVSVVSWDMISMMRPSLTF